MDKPVLTIRNGGIPWVTRSVDGDDTFTFTYGPYICIIIGDRWVVVGYDHSVPELRVDTQRYFEKQCFPPRWKNNLPDFLEAL